MTEDGPMETNTTSTEPPEAQTSTWSPKSLVRPRNGRTVAGVAAGLAQHLGIGVGLVRIGFVVASFFGGAGIALYVAGWLLIRDETEPTSIAQRTLANSAPGSYWLGVGLLALAAVIVLDNITFLPGSLLWAALFVVVGVLLYRGDLPGQFGAASRSPGSAQTPVMGGAEETGSGGVSGDALPPAPPHAYVPPTPPPPPAPRRPPSILGRVTIGVALLALGVMAVVDNLTPAIHAQPRHYLALATIVLGLGLIIGGWLGRARWMILLGFFVIPPLLASPLAEVEWQDIRARFEPISIDAIQPRYDINVGSAVFDLTAIDWDGETVAMAVDMGLGELIVIVPEGVAVTGRAEVGVGSIETSDSQQGGVGDVNRTLDVAGDRGRIDLDLELGVGAIQLRIEEADQARSGPIFESTTTTTDNIQGSN